MTSAPIESSPRLKVLSFTSLYPNAAQPRHGIFVENRLRELAKTHGVDVTVVAPVPWFPFKGEKFGRYGTFARVPKIEERYGITIYHPRYPVIPKIGMNLAPGLMFAAVYGFLKRLHKEHHFDLLDGHFLYPDGVAASLAAKRLNLPVINTARGNDVSLYTQFPLTRKQVVWCIENSSATISVCKFLADEIEALKTRQTRNLVMRNGVDLDVFSEQNRESTRESLGLKRFTLISVGGLIERKGHDLIIDAVAGLPDCELLIIGDGPLEKALNRKVLDMNLQDRVRLLGLVEHHRLADFYSAADCMVLASSSEGWANVLLESMACGTPVVATKVSGTPEVVRSDQAGLLLDQRSADAIRDSVTALRQSYPDREKVREYASAFSWQETSDALFSLMTELAEHTSSDIPYET